MNLTTSGHCDRQGFRVGMQEDREEGEGFAVAKRSGNEVYY